MANVHRLLGSAIATTSHIVRRENRVRREIIELSRKCYNHQMVTLLSTFGVFFAAIFKGKQELALENLALRQQLGVYLRKENGYQD